MGMMHPSFTLLEVAPFFDGENASCVGQSRAYQPLRGYKTHHFSALEKVGS
jgi:hypothetical protein